MVRPLLLLLMGALLGCAEMREPAGGRVPPGLAVASPDPVPVIAGEVAAAFADGGRALAGNPALTARAVGQVEHLSGAIQRDQRWAALPVAVGSELRTARLEWRSALGIRSGAAPDAVAAALGRASLALRGGDSRTAAAALDPALFEPGGVVTLARLAAPGPMPQVGIATRVAQGEIARLEQTRTGGLTGALDPDSGALGGVQSGSSLQRRF